MFRNLQRFRQLYLSVFDLFESLTLRDLFVRQRRSWLWWDFAWTRSFPWLFDPRPAWPRSFPPWLCPRRSKWPSRCCSTCSFVPRCSRYPKFGPVMTDTKLKKGISIDFSDLPSWLIKQHWLILSMKRHFDNEKTTNDCVAWGFLSSCLFMNSCLFFYFCLCLHHCPPKMKSFFLHQIWICEHKSFKENWDYAEILSVYYIN